MTIWGHLKWISLFGKENDPILLGKFIEGASKAQT